MISRRKNSKKKKKEKMHEEIATRSSTSMKFSQQDLVSCPSMLQNDTVTVSIIQHPETSQMNNHHHHHHYITTSANDINSSVITNIVSSHTKIIVSNELPIVKDAVISSDIMNDANNILNLPVMDSCDTENSSLEPLQADDLELKDSTTNDDDDEEDDASQEEKGESFLLHTFTASQQNRRIYSYVLYSSRAISSTRRRYLSLLLLLCC